MKQIFLITVILFLSIDLLQAQKIITNKNFFYSLYHYLEYINEQKDTTGIKTIKQFIIT